MKEVIAIVQHEHDSGYKKILSSKRNFIHFVQKYIDADWVTDIDESNLELVDKSFIEADYQDKESDIIYKMKFKDSEVIFYILTELQSSVNHSMPFRLLKYITELLKREFENTDENVRLRKDYRLPAVVPIILYNGADNWNVVRSFKEYTQGYEIFGDYIVDFKYFLFDLNRKTDEMLITTNRLLDIIFMLDKKPNRKNIEKPLRVAFDKLSDMTEDDRTALLNWIRYILLNHVKDESKKDEIISKFEKGELSGMMYGIDFMLQEERLEGIKEGIIKIAIKMWKKGKSIDDIAEYTDLSKEEVEEIVKDIER